MDDLPPIINISISLKIQPNEGPVFFKVDGTRFGQTRTIKLLTGSKYKIEVVLKPGKAEATLDISSYDAQTRLQAYRQTKEPSPIKRNMNIGGVVFPLERQTQGDQENQEEGGRVVYHGQYDTEGVPHTKSGDRQPIQVSIEFPKAGQFETVWQVKFYNYYKREHCQFGNKFSDIEYECKPNETRTLMWINKEVFN